jgi:hypothetical protein
LKGKEKDFSNFATGPLLKRANILNFWNTDNSFAKFRFTKQEMWTFFQHLAKFEQNIFTEYHNTLLSQQYQEHCKIFQNFLSTFNFSNLMLGMRSMPCRLRMPQEHTIHLKSSCGICEELMVTVFK